MKAEDVEKLLGGFAAGTLTDEERDTLFQAAMRDQSMFDALADEEALRDALADPEFRGRMRDLLAEPAAPQRAAWWAKPWPWATAAALAGLGIVGVYLQTQQSAEQTVEVAQNLPAAEGATQESDRSLTTPFPSEGATDAAAAGQVEGLEQRVAQGGEAQAGELAKEAEGASKATSSRDEAPAGALSLESGRLARRNDDVAAPGRAGEFGGGVGGVVGGIVGGVAGGVAGGIGGVAPQAQPAPPPPPPPVRAAAPAPKPATDEARAEAFAAEPADQLADSATRQRAAAQQPPGASAGQTIQQVPLAAEAAKAEAASPQPSYQLERRSGQTWTPVAANELRVGEDVRLNLTVPAPGAVTVSLADGAGPRTLFTGAVTAGQRVLIPSTGALPSNAGTRTISVQYTPGPSQAEADFRAGAAGLRSANAPNAPVAAAATPPAGQVIQIQLTYR
jgi:hypothetical protein